MENLLDFTKTKVTLPLPNLLDVQIKSFNNFLSKGIGEILAKIFPIDTKNITVEYLNYSVDKPVRSVEDCFRVGATYESRVNSRFRMIFKATGEIKEQEVYLADVPMMLNDSSFIINGRKRVVVQQLIRSPGIFFQTTKDPDTAVINYIVTIIPDRGNWMEIELGRDNVMYIRLKKKMRKIPLTVALKAVGFRSNDEIISTFTRPMTVEVLTTSPFSYELALNKKLLEDVRTSSGKLIASEGDTFTETMIKKLEGSGIEKMTVKVFGVDYWIEQTLKKDRTNNRDEAIVEIYKIFHPRERVTSDAAKELVDGLLSDPARNEYYPVSRYKINKKFKKDSTNKILTKDDYIDTINYLLDIREGIRKEDDIDSLSNRRIRTVGELVAEEFERGIAKVHRNAKDRISISKPEDVRLSEVISAKAISGQLRQFFGASQLSQFMEETNPLAALTHKRRLSSLGAGGLHRNRAGVEVRDVHSSHYSRICPIETPEGQNIGLINSLTTYASVNEYGFITAPYRKVKKGVVKEDYVSLTADEEENYIIAQADTPANEKGKIINDYVIARERTESGEILPRLVLKEKVQLMDITPQQVISASASLIPFLEHDDGNRALMGCNMQRQSVPLLEPNLPRVSTGMEKRIAIDNMDLPFAEEDGIVSFVSSSEVRVVPDDAETEEFSVYREAKDLKANLLNRIKQKEIILFDFKPEIDEYSKFIGDKLTSVFIDKLIGKGIEEISILESEKIQKFSITSCFEPEKNELLLGEIVHENVVTKKNKVLVEAGQKISDTKLNRLFTSNIRTVQVESDGNFVEKPVFYLTLTPVGTNIIGKSLYGALINGKKTVKFVSTITKELLDSLYSSGVTDLLVFSPAEVEKFFLGKVNFDIADRVVAKNYHAQGSPPKKIIIKAGEILSVDALRNLSEEGITKVNVRKEKVYMLKKFKRTNQDTCRNERPIVHKGQRITKGTVIADGYATKNGELALGINVLVAYISWYGFNYQDAVIVSRRLVSDDKLTSIHIKEYQVEVHDTEQGPEELTPDPPDVSKESKRFLDENGIVKVGSKVLPGTILVGKITPFPEEEETNEAKLFRTLFSNRPGNIKNSSFRVPPGEDGTVVDVQVFSREDGYELAKNAIKIIKIFIAKKRKIIVGDKVAGRHGNKGVISKITSEEDLPYLEDGTVVDVVLNPLGVPSRMNIGQLLETNIGLAARNLNIRVITPSFGGASEKDVKSLLKDADLPETGQFTVYDGRTGNPFDYKVTVGESYLLKLNHLAEDKIHARSVGKYTLITQQPVGGKAQFGGQRLGEMEVWALEAYGAANLLQEMMTIKSDDIEGRKRAYEEISKGNTMFNTGIPESFNVLQRGLRGLALDLKTLPEVKKEKPKTITLTTKQSKVILNRKDKEEINEG
jgi:DNA-directed RNA polymerase subunit beta